MYFKTSACLLDGCFKKHFWTKGKSDYLEFLLYRNQMCIKRCHLHITKQNRTIRDIYYGRSSVKIEKQLNNLIEGVENKTQ